MSVASKSTPYREFAEPTSRSEANLSDDFPPELSEQLVDLLADYSRRSPGVVALWCFGIGFVLGWKLKPW
jgi:hypothetical protein